MSNIRDPNNVRIFNFNKRGKLSILSLKHMDITIVSVEYFHLLL